MEANQKSNYVFSFSPSSNLFLRQSDLDNTKYNFISYDLKSFGSISKHTIDRSPVIMIDESLWIVLYEKVIENLFWRRCIISRYHALSGQDGFVVERYWECIHEAIRYEKEEMQNDNPCIFEADSVAVLECKSEVDFDYNN
jgi:hypothetical protein